MRVAFLLPILLLASVGMAAEGGVDTPAVASGNEIQLSITVPPQSLYVIGEPIPIEWKFTNTTAEPLGMFWEGCCFTYGEITAADEKGERLERKLPPPPPNAPPGWTPDPKAAQAWHAFPMVTRIEPHASVTFQTTLDNWLVLSRSGAFKLTAKYTGAPESALKQRGHKLRLWNGKAEAKPFELELLTPRDYVARPPLSDDVALALTAPSRAFSPGVEPFKLALSVQCANDKPLRLHSRLWLVNPDGTRVRSPGAMQTGEIEWAKEHGTTLTTIAVPPEALLGAPLAQQYSAFVDVIDDANPSRRWMSKPVTFVYAFDRENVIALIRDAANRPGVRGERSASIRMLRAYLAGLRPILQSAGMDGEFKTAEELSLYSELKLAAVLTRKKAVDGKSHIELNGDKDGMWHPDDADLAGELKWEDFTTSLGAAAFAKRISECRRDTNADIIFDLLPAKDTQVGAIRELAKALAAEGLQSTRARAPNPPSLGTPVWISLIHEPAPSILIACDGRHGLAFRKKERDPKAPNLEPRFSAAEIEAFRAESKDFLGFDAIRATAAQLRNAGSILLVLDGDATLDGVLHEVRGVGDFELSY